METTTAEKELRERDAAWSQAASEGRDVDEIVSYWTKDAVVIPPGQPAIRGHEAIRAYVEESLRTPGFRISWTTGDVRVSDDGTLAYILGDNEVQVAGPEGQPLSFPGRVVTTWRREPDGQWRCAMDIWNTLD